MTLLVRDEEDIVHRMLSYHLALGVDFVVATDHRSTDATTDVLRAFERDGLLRLRRESGAQVRQAEWVTQMARLAATEHGADWVINADADEFWWPRYSTLRETLASVPPRFGVLRGLWRHFVPRPASAGDFAERMIVRTIPTEDLDEWHHAQVKVVHRADPEVQVSQGNHDAEARSFDLIREWFPFEVLHFPLRSEAQVGRKYGRPEESHRWGVRPPRHIAVAARALSADGDEAYFASRVVDDEAVERGIAAGTLVRDTRLRDAIRALDEERPLPPPRPPTPAEEVALAVEAQAIAATDARMRLDARAHALQQRIQQVETASVIRLARRLA